MAKLSVRTFKDDEHALRHYLQQVDDCAEKARYISPAQEAVYQQKLTEAMQGYGSLIESEAIATGTDVRAVAAAVISQRKAWEVRAHTIEVQRIKAKSAVRKAATTVAKQAAVDAFKQQLTLLQ
ncbi:hypothetical protein ACQKFL_11190 [Vreelandella titanicae]|uniref:hypothetical protein n=1 Tax=Vreelandella titanicae TaxID=664683 RepID=UPI003D05BC3D|tara:strand:- start:2645 stop:3016 length:372 start_codon:yes stop_codon:yes gene_type:complete